MSDPIEISDNILKRIEGLGKEKGYISHARYFTPSHSAVSNLLIDFGVSDASVLASLILSAWPLLFPRDGRPKCSYVHHFSNGRCNAPIAHTMYDEQNKELVMICEKHHKTIQRKPRVYR